MIMCTFTIEMACIHRIHLIAGKSIVPLRRVAKNQMDRSANVTMMSALSLTKRKQNQKYHQTVRSVRWIRGRKANVVRYDQATKKFSPVQCIRTKILLVTPLFSENLEKIFFFKFFSIFSIFFFNLLQFFLFFSIAAMLTVQIVMKVVIKKHTMIP